MLEYTYKTNITFNCLHGRRYSDDMGKMKRKAFFHGLSFFPSTQISPGFQKDQSVALLIDDRNISLLTLIIYFRMT